MKKAIRFLALMLALMAALPAQALTIHINAQESALLPPQALAVLQTLLDKTALCCTPSGFCLQYDGEALLYAGMNGADGYIAAGGTVSRVALPAVSFATPQQTAQALGALLQPWETEQTREIDLQEAGVCRRQLVYTLSGEDWRAVWDDVLPLLLALTPAAEALRTLEIEGKGTFKRYFDRGGNETGAYFYAEQCRLNGDTREVRLEYAFQPEKGFYIAFRCPSPGQTRNLRVALHGKYASGAYRVSGDIRQTGETGGGVLTLNGSAEKLTADLSRRTEAGTAKYRLSLERLGAQSLSFAYSRERQLVLSGSILWDETAAAPPAPPSANGDTAAVAAAFSRRLAQILRGMDQNGVQALLHCVGSAQLLQGPDRHLAITYDPAYRVTEEEN